MTPALDFCEHSKWSCIQFKRVFHSARSASVLCSRHDDVNFLGSDADESGKAVVWHEYLRERDTYKEIFMHAHSAAPNPKPFPGASWLSPCDLPEVDIRRGSTTSLRVAKREIG
jgi:hypothetical protein